MGTHCVPILVDFYLYSYEANFIQGLLKKHEQKLVRSFYFTLCYTGDVLSLYKFGLYCWSHLSHWPWDKGYPDTVRSSSYTDIRLEKYSECWLRTKLRKKKLFLFSHCKLYINMQQHSSSTFLYGVYISQWIWYSRECGSYHIYLKSGWQLSRKLQNQGLSWSHHFESCAVANII